MFSFFFNDPTPTEIYTLSLHDALPILVTRRKSWAKQPISSSSAIWCLSRRFPSKISQCRNSSAERSEEHTCELQSHSELVCRLLLEKKNSDRLHLTLPRQ